MGLGVRKDPLHSQTQPANPVVGAATNNGVSNSAASPHLNTTSNVKPGETKFKEEIVSMDGVFINIDLTFDHENLTAKGQIYLDTHYGCNDLIKPADDATPDKRVIINIDSELECMLGAPPQDREGKIKRLKEFEIVIRNYIENISLTKQQQTKEGRPLRSGQLFEQLYNPNKETLTGLLLVIAQGKDQNNNVTYENHIKTLEPSKYEYHCQRIYERETKQQASKEHLQTAKDLVELEAKSAIPGLGLSAEKQDKLTTIIQQIANDSELKKVCDIYKFAKDYQKYAGDIANYKLVSDYRTVNANEQLAIDYEEAKLKLQGLPAAEQARFKRLIMGERRLNKGEESLHVDFQPISKQLRRSNQELRAANENYEFRVFREGLEDRNFFALLLHKAGPVLNRIDGAWNRFTGKDNPNKLNLFQRIGSGWNILTGKEKLSDPSSLTLRGPYGYPEHDMFGRARSYKKNDPKFPQIVNDLANATNGSTDLKIRKFKTNGDGKIIKDQLNRLTPRKFLGFFSSRFNATDASMVHVQFDDDMNRIACFLGNYVSGFSRWWNDQRTLHLWNRSHGQAFIEYMAGAHHKDKKASAVTDVALLIESMTFDHLSTNLGKNRCKNSPFLNQTITNLDYRRKGSYTENGEIIARPKDLGLLNFHFLKIENVLWEAANVAGHWSGCIIRNSQMVLTGGKFVNCSIGDSYWRWLRGDLTEIGFKGSNHKGAAQGVKFHNTTVRMGTNFYGAIESGEIHFNAFSLAHFSPSLWHMTEFKIPAPVSFALSLRFIDMRYNSKVLKESLDPKFKERSNEGLFDLIPFYSSMSEYYHHWNTISTKKTYDRLVENAERSLKNSQKQVYMRAKQYIPNWGFRLLYAGNIQKEAGVDSLREFIVHPRQLFGMFSHALNCHKKSVEARNILPNLSQREGDGVDSFLNLFEALVESAQFHAYAGHVTHEKPLGFDWAQLDRALHREQVIPQVNTP